MEEGKKRNWAAGAFFFFLALDLLYFFLKKESFLALIYTWGILFLLTVFSAIAAWKIHRKNHFMDPAAKDSFRKKLLKKVQTYLPKKGSFLEVTKKNDEMTRLLRQGNMNRSLGLLVLDPDFAPENDLETYYWEERNLCGPVDSIFINNLYDQTFPRQETLSFLENLSNLLKPGGEIYFLDQEEGSSLEEDSLEDSLSLSGIKESRPIPLKDMGLSNNKLKDLDLERALLRIYHL